MPHNNSQHHSVDIDRRFEGTPFFYTAGMKFVEVKAGKFRMGSNQRNRLAAENERPLHVVDIPYDYYMARFPITNAEYAVYIRSQPMEYMSPFASWKKNSDHPAVHVSWKSAQDYARWLNDIVGADLPLGLILRLPTEAEWEKAACGARHFIYPWGNMFERERNNSDGRAELGTTPVGAYSPQGDSPYQCADMTGNVWEWTHSLLTAYPYNVSDGRESEKERGNHVSRGGCFLSGASARCASREGSPGGASRTTGFRLVASTALA